MRIGVTGGGGFVGRSLVAELASRGHEVVVVDERPVGCSERHSGRASSPDLARWLAGCERIYHLEWSGSFRQAVDDPEGTRKRNLSSLQNVLAVGIPVVFSSTSLVYGGNLNHPCREDQDVAPRAPYGRQKLEAEELVRAAGGCAVRVFNIYGTGSTDSAQIIPRLLASVSSDQVVRLNGDGLQQRDFVHVEDAARALAGLVDCDIAGRVMNLSSGVGTTMLELVQLVFGAAGVEPRIEWKPAVAGEARVICGDPAALQALTDWRPDYSLREGIQTLLTKRP